MPSLTKRQILSLFVSVAVFVVVVLYGYGLWRARMLDRISSGDTQLETVQPPWAEKIFEGDRGVALQSLPQPVIDYGIRPLTVYGTHIEVLCFWSYSSSDAPFLRTLTPGDRRNLKHLSLEYDRARPTLTIPPNGILPTCETLSILELPAFDADHAAWIHDSFPSLSDLELSTFELNWEATRGLSDLGIKSLTINEIDSSDGGIIPLDSEDTTHLVAAFPHLQSLFIDFADAEAVGKLGSLSQLKMLTLYGSLADPNFGNQLAKLTHPFALFFNPPRLPGDSKRPFGTPSELPSSFYDGPPMPNIRVIVFDQHRLQPETVVGLSRRFPNAESLTFRNGALDGDALHEFARFSRLESLDIRTSHISDPATRPIDLPIKKIYAPKESIDDGKLSFTEATEKHVTAIGIR